VCVEIRGEGNTVGRALGKSSVAPAAADVDREGAPGCGASVVVVILSVALMIAAGLIRGCVL